MWIVGSVIGLLIAWDGLDHGLPFIDFPDEMTVWTMGRAVLDPGWNRFQPEYPPGWVWVSALVQHVQHLAGDPFIDPAGTVRIMRVFSVVGYTLTLALVMRLARRLIDGTGGMMRGQWSGIIAGVSAGAFWIVLPRAMWQARQATVDPWLCAWMMLAISAGVEGYLQRSARWIILSIGLGLIAATFKWQGGAALALSGLAILPFWRTDRVKFARLIGIYIAAVGLYGLWAIFIHRALEDGTYLPGTETSLPTPGAVLTNISYALFSPVLQPISGILTLIVLLPIVSRVWRWRVLTTPLWTFPFVMLMFSLVISINGAPVFDRHYMAILALQSSIAGVGLAFSIHTIQHLQIVSRFARHALTGALVVLIAAILFPQAQSVAGMTAEMRLPDRRPVLAQWADTMAVEGRLIALDRDLASVIDPLYGYRGTRIATPEWGAYTEGERVSDGLLRDHEVRYVVTLPNHPPDGVTLPLTPIRTLEGGATRGTPWQVLYVGELPLLPAQHWLTFGESVQIRGHAFSPTAACPGDTITMQLIWGTIKPPNGYFSFFLHLWSESTGELSAPINGQPPISERRPTLTWTDTAELLVAPPQTWTLPDDLAVGRYELWLGVYDAMNGRALLTDEGRHYHVLTSIEGLNCESDDA